MLRLISRVKSQLAYCTALMKLLYKGASFCSIVHSTHGYRVVFYTRSQNIEALRPIIEPAQYH